MEPFSTHFVFLRRPTSYLSHTTQQNKTKNNKIHTTTPQTLSIHIHENRSLDLCSDMNTDDCDPWDDTELMEVLKACAIY